MAGSGRRMSPQARLLQRRVFGRLVRNVAICVGVFALAFVLLATFAADPVAGYLEDAADTWTFSVTSAEDETAVRLEIQHLLDSRPEAVWDVQTNPVDGTIWVRDLSLYYLVSAMWLPALILVCLVAILGLVLSAFRRIYGLVDDLTLAVTGIVERQGEPVVLPPELAVAEGELEDLRRESIAREETAERERRRTHELMAYLTHDVRTPLTAVLGNLELLREDATLDDEARGEVATALRRAREMEDLTGDLFDTTRLALDPASIARKPVDLGLITLQVMDELRGAPADDAEGGPGDGPASEPEDHGGYESVGQPVMVLADPDLLAKAIEHLLHSARALDGQGSSIDIIGGAREGTAFLAAHVPMACLTSSELRATVAHAFEPYYRKGSSNGVSLAFAREIARAHGGDVEAHPRDDAIDLVLTMPARGAD